MKDSTHAWSKFGWQVKIISEAFEEKLSNEQIDEAILHDAQKTLMASKSRLEAEMGWFIDLAPNRTKQIIEKVKANSDTTFFKTLLLELNGISKANLAAHICYLQKDDIESLGALIAAQSEILEDSIKASINATRRISGFPEVDNQLITQHLEKQRQQWAEAALQQIAESDHPGNFMTTLLGDFEDSNLSSKLFLDNLMDRYESFIIPKLRDYEDRINQLISKVQEENQENASTLVLEIICELKLWDEYAQPSQLVYSAKGLDEPRSNKIFARVRDLALWLANEKGEHKLSLELSKASRAIFAELPSVSNMIDDDIGTLEGLISEAESFDLATPLITIILPLFKDEKALAKALKRKDFSADAPGVAGELYRAFLKVRRDAENTEHVNLPWDLIRKLIIHINNERENPELAGKILSAISLLNPPADVKDQITQDIQANKENILGKKLRQAIEARNTSLAKSILNDLIEITESQEEKKEWQSLLKTLNDNSRKALIKWIFWLAIIGGIIMLSECDTRNGQRSSYSSTSKSSYSSNNQIVEHSDSPIETQAAPPTLNNKLPPGSIVDQQSPSTNANTNHFSKWVSEDNKHFDASFKCSEAKSTLEILICSDTELANFDGLIGGTYNLLRQATASDSEIYKGLLEEQREFLKTRLETCKIPYQATLSEIQTQSIISCLKGVYSKRLAVLQGYMDTITKETQPSSKISPEIKNAIGKGVKKFLDIWRETGTYGVKSFISNCEAPAENELVSCLSFDSTASTVISYVEEQNNYPKTLEFQPSAYQTRMRKRLLYAGITDPQKQTNIIAGIEREINSELEVLAASNKQ